MKYTELIKEALRSRSFNLKEFLTRSEGPELFTTVLNDKLFQGLQPDLVDGIMSVYDEVALDNGRVMNFPSVRGLNINHVPENAEFQRAQWEITGVSVEPLKFGALLGLTREMLDQSMLSLIGRQAAMLGQGHRDLRRREMVKCLSFFSTGASVSTGLVGSVDNHGQFYPQIGYNVFISATAFSYEQRISVALEQLLTQRVTITAAGIDLPFPVIPDTIIAHPTHRVQFQKVLNASITVVAAGDKGTTNVAGNNILNGTLANQIWDPDMPSGQILIGKAKAGTVLVRQSQLQIDEIENFYFDAHDVRSKEEFLPAVVESRYWADVQVSG